MQKKPTYEELERRVQELEASLMEQMDFKALFDHTPNGIFLIDLSGKILKANGMGAKRLGKKPEELLGTKLMDYFPPEISKKRRLKGIEALKTGKPQKIEDRVDNKWYSSTIFPIMNENTGQKRLAIFSVDITEQKKTEGALRDSEEKYRVTFESITDSITVTRMTDGLYRYVNDGFCQQTGYSQEEVLGKTPSDINLYANPGERERFIGILQKDGKAENVVVSFRRKNGEVYYSEFSAKPILYLGEECLLAQSRDITTRKRAENELRKNERYFFRILQTALDGFWVLDQKGRVVDVNDAYCEMSEYTRDEIIGLAITDLDALESPLQTAERIERIMSKGSDAFETEHRRKDGSIWPVEISTTYLEEYGGSFVCFCRDMTERKRAEKDLQESENRLKLALDAVSDSVWDWQVNTDEVYLSPKWYTMLGYEPYELPQEFETWRRLIHPNDLAVSESAVFHSLESGQAFEAEFRMRTKDNQWKWVLGRGKVVQKDQNGEPLRMIGTNVDITSRKMAEDEILNQKKKAETYLNLAGVMFIGLDLDGKVTITNQHACKVLECSESDIVGQDWFRTFLPKIVRCGTRDIFTKLVNGQIDQLEYSENSVIAKGGKEKVIAWHNTCLKGPDGRITGMLSAGEDITEKRFLQERYKSIIRTAMDGFVRTDSIGGILEVNPAYCQMTGYNETELLQMKIEDLECHQSPEEVKKQIQKIINVGQNRFQSQHRCKDGTTIDVEVIIQYREEDAEQLVSFIRDISAQKAQVRELNFQAMLLDQIQDLVTATDMDGRIIYVNEAVCRNIKKKRDAILGLSVESFGENPEKGMTQKQIMERTKEHGQWRGEVVNYAADGTELIIDCRTKLVRNESGDPVSMVGISTDITEQKRISEFLQQAQKMESIGNLAGGIAHDFNNILFPILGMSELLLEDIPSDALEHEKLQHIQKAAERGSKLVNQILAFSRLSEHKMIPIGIQQVLAEALPLIRSSIPANISISSNISKKCGLVNADPNQIHQVIMNLVTNAYHAVEEIGGSISVNLHELTIEPENMPIASLLPGKYARLSISDNGYGIAPAHLDKIFEPYFTTKPQGKGTGLGLAVVYGIIKEHGGDIGAKSEPGKGSVFDVYLPLIEKAAKTDVRAKPEKHPTGIEQILLVDDENAVIQVEKQMLERLGYTVTSSIDSEDALAIFRSYPDRFDLVITDMAMPKMTGLQIAREMVSIRPNIPIILCTGFSEPIRQKNLKKLSVEALLRKPLSKAQLANTVRDVLDESRKRTESRLTT